MAFSFASAKSLFVCFLIVNCLLWSHSNFAQVKTRNGSWNTKSGLRLFARQLGDVEREQGLLVPLLEPPEDDEVGFLSITVRVPSSYRVVLNVNSVHSVHHSLYPSSINVHMSSPRATLHLRSCQSNTSKPTSAPPKPPDPPSSPSFYSGSFSSSLH